MSLVKRGLVWLFAPPQSPIHGWRVVAWWELRRIPFNLLMGAYGVVCLAIFYWAILTSGRLEPGDDPVEPLALMAAPFAVNAFYTLGWLVELPARCLWPSISPQFGPWLLRLGLGFSLLLITVPAAFWGGVGVLQLFRVLH